MVKDTSAGEALRPFSLLRGQSLGIHQRNQLKLRGFHGAAPSTRRLNFWCRSHDMVFSRPLTTSITQSNWRSVHITRRPCSVRNLDSTRAASVRHVVTSKPIWSLVSSRHRSRGPEETISCCTSCTCSLCSTCAHPTKKDFSCRV